MILDDDELAAVTKVRCRKRQMRYTRQREALTAMGIAHVVRPDGSLVVSRAHVEQLLNGGKRATVARPFAPDWDALAKVTKA